MIITSDQGGTLRRGDMRKVTRAALAPPVLTGIARPVDTMAKAGQVVLMAWG